MKFDVDTGNFTLTYSHELNEETEIYLHEQFYYSSGFDV
jgi:hypothetical protein